MHLALAERVPVPVMVLHPARAERADSPAAVVSAPRVDLVVVDSAAALDSVAVVLARWAA
jgi:hypothetical protein